jgi:hypothetical protein
MPIQSIRLTIQTGRNTNAGTDGWVYLGFGGREFRVASDDFENFEKGRNDTYRFGDDGNVRDPDVNDPRVQTINIGGIRHYPTYIRFQPLHSDDQNDNWHLLSAFVKVDSFADRWKLATVESRGIWLGLKSGLIAYLEQQS